MYGALRIEEVGLRIDNFETGDLYWARYRRPDGTWRTMLIQVAVRECDPPDQTGFVLSVELSDVLRPGHMRDDFFYCKPGDDGYPEERIENSPIVWGAKLDMPTWEDE